MTYRTNAGLFVPPSHSPIGDAVSWLTGTLLGSLAVSLCVIGVAAVGFMMLSGRLSVRHGLRVALGCFVLLGAPAIAASLTTLWQTGDPVPPPAAPPSPPEDERGELPPAQYDPYAGASLRRD